jgi:tetratricopeptide (TPR) repeat protein
MPESDDEPDASVDLPLMDLSLPTPGEAMASITGAPAGSMDFLELSEPTEEPVAEPADDTIEEPTAPAESTRSIFSPSEDFELPADAFALRDEASDGGRGTDGESASLTTIVPDGSMPTPPAARRSSTLRAEQSVELLQALVAAEPEDHGKRRQLAEAMLESGDREGGMQELERAMVGFERADDLDAASSLADEIVRLNPESVRHHQKRVEYAFRTNERGRLIEAYLALADALFRAGQTEKSRAIYHRVLDLAPDDLRAQAALESFVDDEPEPAPEPPASRVTGSSPRVPSKPSPVPSHSSDDEFVNLGDWLRDDDAPKDTRMIVEEKEPSGDEEADFQDMLRKFKQGIADNVEEEDHQSHYDLGVAYKEMGLLDEAIAEFQKALRAPSNRVPTYEALGQCFMEKEQLAMAATILSRALHEKGVSEDQLVGVLYLLGRCAEARGQREQAIEYYQRVFVIDIQFRDVGERLVAVESARS